MIKLVNNSKEIIDIWREAFGDSEEEILFFADNVKDAECLGFYSDGVLASMMYVVRCSINGVDSNYIYAACTLKEYRSKGLMTELLSYAESAYSSLCLIPANEGLVEYYALRGFDETESVNALSFSQTDEINEYLFDGCSLEKPIVLMYKGEK